MTRQPGGSVRLIRPFGSFQSIVWPVLVVPPTSVAVRVGVAMRVAVGAARVRTAATVVAARTGVLVGTGRDVLKTLPQLRSSVKMMTPTTIHGTIFLADDRFAGCGVGEDGTR